MNSCQCLHWPRSWLIKPLPTCWPQTTGLRGENKHTETNTNLSPQVYAAALTSTAEEKRQTVIITLAQLDTAEQLETPSNVSHSVTFPESYTDTHTHTHVCGDTPGNLISQGSVYAFFSFFPVFICFNPHFYHLQNHFNNKDGGGLLWFILMYCIIFSYIQLNTNGC